jgi:predicted metal-dependent hydrolase
MARRPPRQLELPLLDRSREPVARAHTALEGHIVEYTIRRTPRRRTITLSIDERGLRIGAPWHAPGHAVEREINRHAKWVLRKLDEWAARRPATCAWQDGEAIMLLGEARRLTVLSHPQPAELQDGRLVLGCREPHDPAQIRAEVGRWLREQARACFVGRAAHYAPLLRVPPPAIRLSNARTRWGSCHPAGYVLLNWRLVHLPLPLLDYVVVHELAHLRELNHSARFWRLVASVIPDHAARRAEIRSRAHEYLAT